MICQGVLSDDEASSFDSELNKTDIVLSLDCADKAADTWLTDEKKLSLSHGFIGLRTRGGAAVSLKELRISKVKNDAWQLWNGGSSVERLFIKHDAAIEYCDDNHPDCLQAFTKPSGDFDPDNVFDGLRIDYAKCVIECDDPERSRINGFLFTEICQYLNVYLFGKGLDYISNSPAPYFLDMTNASNLQVGSAEHPIDPDRVSGKGIRIGARGDKSEAPECENIVIHAYRGLSVVLEGSAKSATNIIWYEKGEQQSGLGGVMSDKSKILKMSTAGVRQLIESEKPMPNLYYCEAGVPTIGVGHEVTRSQLNSGKIPLSDGSVIDFRNNRALSHDEIMRLLSDDLISREQVVYESVKVPLDQSAVDALVHFVFNIGRTAFKNSTLLRELNGFDYAEVPTQIKRWKYVTKNGVKTESKGLINRRLTEVRMWHGSDTRSDDMREWADKMAAPAVTLTMPDQDGIDLVAAAKSLGIGSATDFKSQMSELGVIVERLKKADSASAGFDQTIEIARRQAQSEFDEKLDRVKADAVDSFLVKNKQKPLQSRTNRTVVGMIVITGLRFLVTETGLSSVFADPAVAELATSAAVVGMDIITAGLGVLAIKFRNVATKFIG